ncbi:hypothetical protein MPF19_05385 [Polaribacter sp. Z014]|uniref:hypothetical protein n=1 Tax=Polaribacter sp. Z014 TaxID=2927126 RepID=UPI00201FD872|nr:hypothetical protein [Polaribacter sp. Z014]MCL7762841.1 hypothetical protein [Polaribacter sp. Z014]
MKNIIFFFLFLPSLIFAQSSDLPKNPKPGKCYIRCSSQDFNYTKPVNKKKLWVELECHEARNLTIDAEKEHRFQEYQKLLKEKDFDVDITGVLDLKTAKAHNKYLKVLKKENRKKAKNKKK